MKIPIGNSAQGLSLARLAVIAAIVAVAAFVVSWRISLLRNAASRQLNKVAPLELRPSVLDYGDIDPQQHPIATFTLANESRLPIEIASLIPSCGCISARCASHSIPVGGETTLQVKFEGYGSGEAVGPFGKYVSILYKLKKNGKLHSLRAMVHGNLVSGAPFSVYPTRLNLGRVKQGTKSIERIYLNGRHGLLESLPMSVSIGPGKTREISLSGSAKLLAPMDQALAVNVKIQDVWRCQSSPIASLFQFAAM